MHVNDLHLTANQMILCRLCKPTTWPHVPSRTLATSAASAKNTTCVREALSEPSLLLRCRCFGGAVCCCSAAAAARLPSRSSTSGSGGGARASAGMRHASAVAGLVLALRVASPAMAPACMRAELAPLRVSAGGSGDEAGGMHMPSPPAISTGGAIQHDQRVVRPCALAHVSTGRHRLWCHLTAAGCAGTPRSLPIAGWSNAHCAACNTVSRLLLQSSDAGSAPCSATPFLGLPADSSRTVV